jgi:hypothetical protein
VETDRHGRPEKPMQHINVGGENGNQIRQNGNEEHRGKEGCSVEDNQEHKKIHIRIEES